MTKNEIPAGTRAIMFCFTTTNGTPRVTFDLLRYPNNTYAELEMVAIDAVLRAGKGEIVEHKAHFIN